MKSPNSVNVSATTTNTPAQATISLTSPHGGETITAGAQVTVSWNSTGTIDSVAIELSTDGGTTFPSLLAKTLNDGSQSVILPAGLTGTACRVRVKSLNGAASDTSNGTFTIAEVLAAPALIIRSLTTYHYALPATRAAVTTDLLSRHGSLSGSLRLPPTNRPTAGMNSGERIRWAPFRRLMPSGAYRRF